jgi:hypothetical protein
MALSAIAEATPDGWRSLTRGPSPSNGCDLANCVVANTRELRETIELTTDISSYHRPGITSREINRELGSCFGDSTAGSPIFYPSLTLSC